MMKMSLVSIGDYIIGTANSNFIKEEKSLDSERESLHSKSELWFTLKSENASCPVMSDSLRPHGL